MSTSRRLLLGLALLGSGAEGPVARAQPPRAQPAVARPGPAASALLARPVSLPALRAPLEMVLRETARRAGVSLAYSASRLPLTTEVSIAAQARQPLDAVLAVVLRDQSVAYGVLDGQLVLWRRADAPPPGVVVGTGSTAAPRATPALAGTARRPVPPARKAAPLLPATATPAATAAATARRRGARAAPADLAAAAPGVADALITRSQPMAATRATALLPAGQRSNSGGASATAAVAAPGLAGSARAAGTGSTEVPLLVGRVVVVEQRPDSLTDALAGGVPTLRARVRPTPAPWAQRTVQVSLLPPLSTNWRTNNRTVNRISINLLAGYAAGVRGVEVGLLVNTVRDSAAGLQAAGVLNIANGPVVGAQVAGLGNVARGSLEGVQSAGLWNTVRGSGQGWQSAGFFNRVLNEPAAGVPPTDPTTAPEPIVQLAGFFNLAPRGLKGAQVAGLFNSAGRVRGMQIAGLLNIADTVAGVSLAPLNFVRHGYHTLEISTDGSWPGMLTLKLGGSAAFYTYFVGAWDWRTAHRWGLGYGVGGEIASRRRLSLSLDAHALQVNQDDASIVTWVGATNLHLQFRPLIGWATGPRRRLRLLAGPAFNLFVTDRAASLTASTTDLPLGGSDVFLDARSSTSATRVLGWVSGIGGVRWQF